MYDPRAGRFFAVDPLFKQYPWYTPYSFSGNKVIRYIELEGEEEVDYVKKLDYNGDAFDYLKVLPNAAISLNNSVNVLWNSAVATTKKIYHDGFVSYGKAVGNEVVQTGKGIGNFVDEATDYHANTPVKQQLIDFVSPQNLEQGLSMSVEAYVGSKFIGPRQLPVKNASPVISTIDDAVVEGGAYGRMKNVIDDAGKNITEKNHLPSKQAFKLSELKISDYMGSAHIMDKLDHRSFISTGSSKAAQAFRELESQLLNQGKYLEAFDLNAKQIRKQFGNKYDEGLKQARKHFEEEVIPILKEQAKTN